MDNVTHTLAGMLLAESVVQFRSRRTTEPGPSSFRRAAVIASAIAANFPDADLLYTGIGGNPLSYLLHHRGYTHTFAVAVPSALLLWVVTMGLWRWRARLEPDAGDSRWMLGLLIASTVSHLALDWTNSYGVHLLWPFDDRWQYGDLVFIIEPWLWVVSIPALVIASRSRFARGLLSAALIGVLGVAWLVDFVSPGTAIALTLGTMVSIVVARGLRPGPRVAMAVAAWALATLVMSAGATAARIHTLRAVRAADMSSQILDVVVSPLPANPFCASVISVERSRRFYRVTTARVSAAPSITPAAACPSRDGGTSDFRPSGRRSNSALQWEREWTGPAMELVMLARQSCPALAALRFMRVPVWTAIGDSAVLLGDARFGGGSGRGFSDVRVPRLSAMCPAHLPPWTPPRADILG